MYACFLMRFSLKFFFSTALHREERMASVRGAEEEAAAEVEADAAALGRHLQTRRDPQMLAQSPNLLRPALTPPSSVA